MPKTKNWIVVLGLLYLGLVSNPSPTYASELSIAPSTTLDGLTFLTPFYLPKDSATNTNFLKSLPFGNPDTLYVVEKPKNADLSELVTTPPPTPTPTPKPVKTPAPTITPDPTPTTILTPSPTATPATTPTLSQGGLNADKIFDLVNAYRASKNLAPLQKDERACQLAASRAPEINAEIAGGYMHRGLKNRNLQYWNSENIISMNSEEAAVNWWIHDYIHRVQIEADNKYSCVACSGNACAQEFTNFTVK